MSRGAETSPRAVKCMKTAQIPSRLTTKNVLRDNNGKALDPNFRHLQKRNLALFKY